MIDRDKIQKEVDENFEAFKKLLPSLLGVRKGKFVLMRHKKMVEVFDSAGDAKLYAQAQFSDGLWSIQQVTDQVADLGYFSHAVHNIELCSDDRSNN